MSGLQPEVVRFALAGLAGSDLRHQAARILDRFEGGFAADAAGVVADALEDAYPDADPSLVAELAGSGPARAYLRARLLGAWNRPQEAEAQLDTCVASLPRADSTVLALRARWRLRRGEIAGAVRDLRLALQLFPDYPFYARTEKVVEKLVGAGAWTPRRRCRVALLASSTTALLAPVLRSALFRDGIVAETYEGPYGAFRQEILDPGSGLYRFAPDHVLLLVNHRDLAMGPDGGLQGAREAVVELRRLWRLLQERQPCHVIQSYYDRPVGGGWGFLESTLPEGRRRAVAMANAELGSELPSGVSLLDVEALPLPEGISLVDEEGWHSTKQYPSAAALPVFAEAVAAQIRAALGLGSKVLVVDLDNTLWGGVIGEDGLGGIRVGPPTAEGEAYCELQEYARELKARGIVLAVCSKNNLADAQSPFRLRDGMALKLEDFAAFRADWNDKASNIDGIAKELSLGLDSFVFLDDNPFERTLVRERLPEVIVPEVEQSPWAMLRALRRGMYFEATRITVEDLERNLSYQANLAIRTVQQSGESLKDFLQGLGMVCEYGPVSAMELQRVTQLINKTNQFNVTSRRYNEEQVRRMAKDPNWWCHWFRLNDRFGDHGLVGVMLARAEGSRWTVDSWLMSCRILGRRMEEFMCGCLLSAAAEQGAAEVWGEYKSTAKNGMVSDLYRRMGFQPTDNEGTYRFVIGQGEPPRSPWLRGVLRDGRPSEEVS